MSKELQIEISAKDQASEVVSKLGESLEKLNYAARRKEGLRGQGDYPGVIIAIETTPASTVRGLGLRKKRVNRVYTKPNHGRLFQVRHYINLKYQWRMARREAMK